MNISSSHYYHRAVEWIMTSGLHVLLIVVLTFLGVRLLGTLSRRLFEGLAGRAMDAEQRKKVETLATNVHRAVTIAIRLDSSK